MKSDIGSRIRQIRKSHEPPWSMNRLALLAEIDPGQLSRAERGLAGLSLPALTRIAALLNLSLAELVDPEHGVSSKLTGSIDMQVQHLTEKIWTGLKIHQLNQCSPAELNLIRHHIRSCIEEGINRGEIEAEREIERILRKRNPNGGSWV